MQSCSYGQRMLMTANRGNLVSSHFKFVLIVVVPVGFVSRDFCAKVAFFQLNSRQDVRIKCHSTIYN